MKLATEEASITFRFDHSRVRSAMRRGGVRLKAHGKIVFLNCERPQKLKRENEAEEPV